MRVPATWAAMDATGQLLHGLYLVMALGSSGNIQTFAMSTEHVWTFMPLVLRPCVASWSLPHAFLTWFLAHHHRQQAPAGTLVLVLPCQSCILWVAWQRYWSDARRFWQPVYDAFSEGGDFETLKAAYARAGVHRVISADLCALRAALCQARAACESAPPSSGLVGMPAFFDALLLMVRPGREQQAANLEEATMLVQETPFESLAPERPSMKHTTRSLHYESPQHDRKSVESWSTRDTPEADVHGCVSQSTGTPDSDASSAAFFASASTGRISPAQSLVLLEAPTSAIGRPRLGTRADSASPTVKVKPSLDISEGGPQLVPRQPGTSTIKGKGVFQR